MISCYFNKIRVLLRAYLGVCIFYSIICLCGGWWWWIYYIIVFRMV